MSAFRPHKFGRYVIVDPVAVGGMAEIYRARLGGTKEPDRIIVIKKVIANLSQNSEFIQMFEEEIKITVGLTHPNIIQIYDYGKVEEQYFMAMEYVEGKNLRQFVRRLADMKSMFSIEMSCYIISQICHALGYAHAFKDRLSGKPLGIVHRDISPQNIMISYDGAVKLFDFGIAKAKSASEATRAGVIKGKPSYLSPEQINGEELDGRSDIFALGIVLWELLTAKRLFVADTDMGVLRLIQNAKIEPPSTFNPAVSQALDVIVLKSLSRDKAKRYQNAEEFQRDLHKFLYSFNASFNPSDLSYYAQELFKGEIKDDRERLHKALAIEPVADGGGHLEEISPQKSSGKKGKKDDSKLAEGLISTTDFNREMMEQIHENTNTSDIAKVPSLELSGSSSMARPKNVNMGTGGTGKPALPPNIKKPGSDALVIPPWSKQQQTRTSANSFNTRKINRTAKDKELVPDTESSPLKAVVGLVFLLVVGAFAADYMGYIKLNKSFLKDTPFEPLMHLRQDERAPASTGAAPESEMPVIEPGTHPSQPKAASTTNPPVTSNQGLILLFANVDGYSVTVNGVPAKLNGNQFGVPLHVPLTVQVSKAGYESANFHVTAADQKALSYTVKLNKLSMGMLYFNTTPEARLTFISDAGQSMQFNTPVKAQEIPAGHYKVILENVVMGYKSETEVVIAPDKVTRMEKTLK